MLKNVLYAYTHTSMQQEPNYIQNNNAHITTISVAKCSVGYIVGQRCAGLGISGLHMRK